MARWMYRLGVVLVCAGLVTALPGCPSRLFSVEGHYDGTWTSEDAEMESCLLALTLAEINKTVGGVLKFNYECFVPANVAEELALPALSVPLLGSIKNDGRIHLEYSEDALSSFPGLVDEGALEDVPFTLTLTLDGVGKDLNDDGLMDEFTGEFDLYFKVQTNVGGYDTIIEETATGTFVLNRNSE
ncbi:MAG: hypothetical protein QG656_2412 [Candidatus Hydrogenedentes bacterium]|nr:hypothetical protein [Candidatus Hydrogenedentota bacterium]